MVYDPFHVVAKYGRKDFDRVRVDEANTLRQDKPARKVVKSACCLPSSSRSNLDARQAVRLDELLEANQALLTVYLLRDELKQLWHYRRPSWALKAWQRRYKQAMDSGIPTLSRFAERLKPYLAGIRAR